MGSEGILVLAQITPFNDTDEEYWKKIISVRQPLRKHLLTLDNLIVLLKEFDFTIAQIDQFSETDSLNSWVTRYSMSKEAAREFRQLHLAAPESYKSLHRFRKRDGDLLYDKCWTLIRAVKGTG